MNLIVEGKLHNTRLIGSGLTTKAYRRINEKGVVTNTVFLVVEYSDLSKELMCRALDKYHCPRLPYIKRSGTTLSPSGVVHYVYTTKYYKPVRSMSLSVEGYMDWKLLKDGKRKAGLLYKNTVPTNYTKHNQFIVSYVKKNGGSPGLVQTLAALADVMTDYNTPEDIYIFDGFGYGNVRSRRRSIILIDPVFNF